MSPGPAWLPPLSTTGPEQAFGVLPEKTVPLTPPPAGAPTARPPAPPAAAELPVIVLSVMVTGRPTCSMAPYCEVLVLPWMVLRAIVAVLVAPAPVEYTTSAEPPYASLAESVLASTCRVVVALAVLEPL